MRRKLAWALALLLLLLALLALAAWAALVLPARDYRLAWMLSKTKRIEVSSIHEASLVVEITEPGEVAALVSAATARLDRLRRPTRGICWMQARFLLESGEEIVVGHEFQDDGDRQVDNDAVRLPGSRELNDYAIDRSLFDRIYPRLRALNRWVKLGSVSLASYEYEYKPDVSLLRPGESQWDCGVRADPFAGKIRPRRLMTVKGVSLDLVPNHSSDWIWKAAIAPDDDPATVEVDVSGTSQTFSVPPVKHHLPVVPSCPLCGSFEDVLPWQEPGGRALGPFGFRGRCKKDVGAAHDGKFFCEHCQKSF